MVAFMLTVLRVALYLVLFFLLLAVAVALVSSTTGPAEKSVLFAASVVLLWLASVVRRLTTRSDPESI